MKLLVITEPEFNDSEVAKIRALLASKHVFRVHIRKPEADLALFSELVTSFSEEDRVRLTVHSHYEESLRLGVGGVHFNSHTSDLERAKLKGLKLSSKFLISSACHSLTELEVLENIDYLLLSPIFDSVSKPLKAGFDFKDLSVALTNTAGPVFALGGITPETINKAKQLGFAGAATLGYVWQGADPIQQISSLLDSKEAENETLCA